MHTHRLEEAISNLKVEQFHWLNISNGRDLSEWWRFHVAQSEVRVWRSFKPAGEGHVWQRDTGLHLHDDDCPSAHTMTVTLLWGCTLLDNKKSVVWSRFELLYNDFWLIVCSEWVGFRKGRIATGQLPVCSLSGWLAVFCKRLNVQKQGIICLIFIYWLAFTKSPTLCESTVTISGSCY